MSIGGVEDLRTDEEREGTSVCQNSSSTDYNCASRNHFQHTSESFKKCGYFCTQYMFVSQGLQGFTVGRTHDS